jgi:hypothetical protein
MRDWLTKIQTQAKYSSQPIQSNAVVRIIGDRASGKTTYMASLARWPNADASSPVQTVTPINEEGSQLVEKAQNILEQGLELEPTQLNASALDVNDYTLTIALKKAKVGSSQLTLNISCKDYAGEFFTDLLHQAGNSQLEDYLEDCLQATGIMFLIDGTTYRKDSEYANGLDKFLMAVDRTDITAAKRRIAVVLTKCEQPDLWINRHQPAYLASARFPQVYRKLQSWQQMGAGSVDYFTTSAFGMLGTRYQEPNSKQLSRGRDGTTSVLKDPKRWRPFGLVAPIYWLCTGDRHKELDKD